MHHKFPLLRLDGLAEADMPCQVVVIAGRVHRAGRLRGKKIFPRIRRDSDANRHALHFLAKSCGDQMMIRQWLVRIAQSRGRATSGPVCCRIEAEGRQRGARRKVAGAKDELERAFLRSGKGAGAFVDKTQLLFVHESPIGPPPRMDLGGMRRNGDELDRSLSQARLA
jgi:hypothetical protein